MAVVDRVDPLISDDTYSYASGGQHCTMQPKTGIMEQSRHFYQQRWIELGQWRKG